jgi:CcmD family protein
MNLEFLYYGYAAAWLIVLGFIFILVNRGQKIERELSRLKSQLEDKEK